MVVTLNDVVAESNTDIFAAYPNLTFRERDDRVQRTVQYALALSVIDNPEVPGRFGGEIFWLQHPLALFVQQSETVTAFIVDNTKVVVEHITLCSRYIRNMWIYHHLTRCIDELDPSSVIHRSQSVGEDPRKAVFRLNDRFAGEHIKISAFLAVTVAYQ